MKIGEIINFLETVAPVSFQESYDNAGLIYGSPDWECTGVLVSLDITEAVLDEAIQRGYNMVISHHPMVFGSLKKFNPDKPDTRLLIRAIKQDVAVYAIHTNLDNVLHGVNQEIARRLGLRNTQILLPKRGLLKKLYVFVPQDHLEKLRTELFDAGAGHIGNYSECSFSATGTGTFKAGEHTNPYVGEQGKLHREPETRLEVIFPHYLENQIVKAMITAHPYEEVAYDVISLDNDFRQTGSGLTGTLDSPVAEKDFLAIIRERFNCGLIRHSPFTGRPVQKVAICGGAGSFLIPNAIASRADVFITADLKYHDFFRAEGRLLLADIGHFESEQFTSDLLVELLNQKFPTFAVLKTGVVTNPVNYFL